MWKSELIEQLAQALDNKDIDSLGDHFVDAECLEAWTRRDVKGFLEVRETLMNRAEAIWFDGLRAVEFIEGKPSIGT